MVECSRPQMLNGGTVCPPNRYGPHLETFLFSPHMLQEAKRMLGAPRGWRPGELCLITGGTPFPPPHHKTYQATENNSTTVEEPWCGLQEPLKIPQPIAMHSDRLNPDTTLHIPEGRQGGYLTVIGWENAYMGKAHNPWLRGQMNRR